jgi:hypothetical protein
MGRTTKGNLAVDVALAGLRRFPAEVRRGSRAVDCPRVRNSLYDPNAPLSAEAQNGFAVCRVLAKRYKGIVRRYEVERMEYGAGYPPPKLGRPGVYTALLKKVYPALKAVDPEIVVCKAISAWADGLRISCSRWVR